MSRVTCIHCENVFDPEAGEFCCQIIVDANKDFPLPEPGAVDCDVKCVGCGRKMTAGHDVICTRTRKCLKNASRTFANQGYGQK